MENPISLNQIGLYNPQRQSAEVTEALFSVRQKQFELLLNKIVQEKKESIPQHYLIIGQRGMGKTTLFKRMEVELHKPQYQQQFIPLLFPEEPYTVNDLAVFWKNCLDALADSLELENKEKYHALIADIDKTIREASGKTPEIMPEEAYKYLMRICRDLRRRPVLLIDNIGFVLSRLNSNKRNEQEQWILRKLLSENGAPIIVSAGVAVTDDVINYGMPFYDFFQIQYLKKLSFEEFQTMLVNLSEVTQSDIAIIYEKTPRLQTLHQLTGGNPRTAVMLFKLIVKGFSAEINDDLEALLDEITPLYKARYEELSEQSQTIIASIALNWEPISLRQLSQQSGYANNQLSPQLKRLIDEGWIETTPAEKAKGNAYYVSERFFNIWFLMRMSARRHKQGVSLLTKFLESFYGSDLERVANNYLRKNELCENELVYGLAIRGSKMLDRKTRSKIENKILSSLNDDVKISDDLRGEISNIKNKTNKIGNDADAYFNKGNAYYKKGNYDKAIECYEKAIEIKPDDATYYNMGLAYNDKGNYDKAIECYQKAIEIKPDKDESYYNMGLAYQNKGNFDKAIECYQKAIEIKPANDAYYNKGNAYYKKGNYDKAIECYEKAIEIKPDKDEAYYNLQALYRDRSGKISEAKELFNKIKDKLETDERFLNEALFELHNRNEGIAKNYLFEALRAIENELPKTTIDNWYYFAAICLQLNYGKWLLDILSEKGFDKILSPYFVAVQALEIEQKENKEKTEIYLKNRAIEISEPARMIIERIRKYDFG